MKHCSFCGSADHNRATCAQIDPLKKQVISLHNELRMKLLDYLVETGHVPGAVLKIRQRKYNDKEADRFIYCLVIGVNPINPAHTNMVASLVKHRSLFFKPLTIAGKFENHFLSSTWQLLENGSNIAAAENDISLHSLSNLYIADSAISLLIPGTMNKAALLHAYPDAVAWLNSSKDVDAWFQADIKEKVGRYRRKYRTLLHRADIKAVRNHIRDMQDIIKSFSFQRTLLPEK
jgi:hypothetical protein